MKKALCFFMAIVFVCCVITYGENERFSVEAMITNLTNLDDMPTIEDLTYIWTSDSYAVDTYAGPGGTSGGDGTVDLERTSFFEKVVGFCNDVVDFLRRCWYTILWFCDMIVSVFDNAKYLLPWNNTVPRGQW